MLFALLLVSTRIIPLSNPYNYNFLSILGLITPVLVVINLFFVFFWLISRKYYFIALPILAIWISWPIFSVCVAGNYKHIQDFKNEVDRFTVLSYNVRLLDLYRWSDDKETRKKMIQFFKEKNASVLCLQEFYSNNDSFGVNNIKAIKEACDYAYVAECNTHVSKRGKWGSVIFSHLPIVNPKNFEIDVVGSNLLQKADIVLEQDTFSVFNVHLKSNRFSKNEAALVNKDKIPGITDSTIEQSKSIFQKLENNAVNRGLEADIISSIISQNQYPNLICGDLNDIPSSYVYFKIRDNLNDVFLEKGFGLGQTYRNTIPILRIDYMFFSNRFALHGYEKMDIPYSDHEPLMANFSILHDSKNLK